MNAHLAALIRLLARATVDEVLREGEADASETGPKPAEPEPDPTPPKEN